MSTEWDDDFKPPPPGQVVAAEFEDEDMDDVKESWEDEEEEESKPQPKPEMTKKDKPQKKAIQKEKVAVNGVVVEEENLTPEQLRSIQQESELRMVKELTFGIKEVDETNLLSNLQNKEDFDTFANVMVSKIRLAKASKQFDLYKDMLTKLITELCLDSDYSESLRHFSKEISALATEKHKQEKEKQKAKQPKKKAQIIGTKKDDLFDIDSHLVEADFGDDEDFM